MVENPQITLVTKETTKVKVNLEFRNISKLIRSILEDSSLNEEISIEYVSEATLNKIIEFCEHHNYTAPTHPKYPLQSNNISDALQDPWDVVYLQSLSKEQLIEIILASNYLDIKSLLEICLAGLAANFKGKEIEEISRDYAIIEDFTAEEEEKLRADFSWMMNININDVPYE